MLKLKNIFGGSKVITSARSVLLFISKTGKRVFQAHRALWGIIAHHILIKNDQLGD